MDMIRTWRALLMLHGDILMEPAFFGRLAGGTIAVMLPLVFIALFTMPLTVPAEVIGLVPLAIGMAFGFVMALRWAGGEIDRREAEMDGE